MKFLFILLQIVCLRTAINVAFDLQPRIINGDPAPTGQFPYFASLVITRQRFLMDCGATLISNEWLLTAAHCLDKADSLVARLGTSNLNHPVGPEYMAIFIEKDNFHIYPFYIARMFWNDIALIRLPRKIPFSENVQPVKMPSNCDSIEDIEAIAMGHGETKIDKFSPQLKFAVLSTVSLKKCRKTYPFLLFRKSVICASNDVRKQSIYYGDSGGPLVRSSDGILIGISSFSSNTKYDDDDDDDDTTQGFTNVYSYLKWIGKMTGMNLPKC